MGLRNIRMMPLAVGLVAVAFMSCHAVVALAGTLPKDACSLLTPAEIQKLAPGADVGSGVPDSSAAPIATGCMYTWGPRSPVWGEPGVTVTVIDLSQAYPGTSAGVLRQGLLAKAKAESGASVVAGVGDAAVFTAEPSSHSASVEAVLQAKGVHLSVSFHGDISPASKDDIAALVKIAAARL
jgi:hypothetical protein